MCRILSNVLSPDRLSVGFHHCRPLIASILPQNGCIVLQARSHRWMLGSECLLPNRQCPLLERLGLRVVVLALIESCQVVEAQGYVGMLGAECCLTLSASLVPIRPPMAPAPTTQIFITPSQAGYSIADFTRKRSTVCRSRRWSPRRCCSLPSSSRRRWRCRSKSRRPPSTSCHGISG